MLNVICTCRFFSMLSTWGFHTQCCSQSLVLLAWNYFSCQSLIWITFLRRAFRLMQRQSLCSSSTSLLSVRIGLRDRMRYKLREINWGVLKNKRSRFFLILKSCIWSTSLSSHFVYDTSNRACFLLMSSQRLEIMIASPEYIFNLRACPVIVES